MKSYFSDKELECPCCGEQGMDEDFVCILNKLRSDFGDQMILSSAFRCLSHNENVGGSNTSQHLIGNAVDILWSGFDARRKYDLLTLALDYGFSGLGVSNEFLHIDRRDGSGKIWVY